MTLGDVLTLTGLGLAVLLYVAQRWVERARVVDSAIAVLNAVHDGIRPWGDLYFGGPYDDEAVKRRARVDYEAVMKKGYNQVFQVPSEPLVALISHPSAGGLIGKKTIERASVSLWQMGLFNQLVRQQTEFYARFLPEISDENLASDRREALANAAGSISHMLHGRIGDASWYAEMVAALEENRNALATRRSRRIAKLIR